LIFEVRGIPYSENGTKLSELINVGEILEYKRDYNNEYDPFALSIEYKGERVGYVPRNFQN
jgi:hypothetical protein